MTWEEKKKKKVQKYISSSETQKRINFKAN